MRRNLRIALTGEELHAELAELFQTMAELSKHKRVVR
jgi:hypothetical protein